MHFESPSNDFVDESYPTAQAPGDSTANLDETQERAVDSARYYFKNANSALIEVFEISTNYLKLFPRLRLLRLTLNNSLIPKMRKLAKYSERVFAEPTLYWEELNQLFMDIKLIKNDIVKLRLRYQDEHVQDIQNKLDLLEKMYTQSLQSLVQSGQISSSQLF